jgi:hypothetical protein
MPLRHEPTAKTVIGASEDAQDYSAFAQAVIAKHDAESPWSGSRCYDRKLFFFQPRNRPLPLVLLAGPTDWGGRSTDDQKGGIIVKTQKAAGGKNAGKLSDAVIEKRYLDLQKLRDAVRTAEMNCAAQTWKKPLYRKASGNLVSAPGRNGRTDFGGQR